MFPALDANPSASSRHFLAFAVAVFSSSVISAGSWSMLSSIDSAMARELLGREAHEVVGSGVFDVMAWRGGHVCRVELRPCGVCHGFPSYCSKYVICPNSPHVNTVAVHGRPMGSRSAHVLSSLGIMGNGVMVSSLLRSGSSPSHANERVPPMASHAPAVTGERSRPRASCIWWRRRPAGSRSAATCARTGRGRCPCWRWSALRYRLEGLRGEQSAHWSRCASLGCQTVPGQCPPLSSTLTASVSNVTARWSR